MYESVCKTADVTQEKEYFFIILYIVMVNRLSMVPMFTAADIIVSNMFLYARYVSSKPMMQLSMQLEL